jgi:hypothetical protein
MLRAYSVRFRVYMSRYFYIKEVKRIRIYNLKIQLEGNVTKYILLTRV